MQTKTVSNEKLSGGKDTLFKCICTGSMYVSHLSTSSLTTRYVFCYNTDTIVMA